MREIIVDGKKFNTEEELHEFFKKELNFPGYYGMNYNAFWDCLTEGFDEPTRIVWINIDQSKERLGEVSVSNFVDMLKEGVEYMKGYPDKFEFEIR